MKLSEIDTLDDQHLIDLTLYTLCTLALRDKLSVLQQQLQQMIDDRQLEADGTEILRRLLDE